MIRQFRKTFGLFAVLVVILLAVDYARVRAKERRLSSIVSDIGGQVASVPAWPIGTEYRITFERALNDEELERLVIANEMRGWVGIAFRNCELSVSDREKIEAAFPKCHLFVRGSGRTNTSTDR